MRILLKYPSRGRPLWFFKTLDLYVRMLSGRHEVTFLCAFDLDDDTMNNVLVKDFLTQITPTQPRIVFYYEEHRGKVAAINSHLSDFEWDMICVISDDIEPTVAGFDNVIANDFTKAFPSGDGLIWYQDGRCGRRRISLPIMDRAFYDRFGWIVHPDYIAWGDDYLTKLWKRTGKTHYIERMVLQHDWKKYVPRDKNGRRKDKTAVRARHHRTADYRTSARLLQELESKT